LFPLAVEVLLKRLKLLTPEAAEAAAAEAIPNHGKILLINSIMFRKILIELLVNAKKLNVVISA
jgi:hypothetical protein